MKTSNNLNYTKYCDWIWLYVFNPWLNNFIVETTLYVDNQSSKDENFKFSHNCIYSFA